LEHFSGIVPCGLTHAGITSLQALKAETDMSKIDAELFNAFADVFARPGCVRQDGISANSCRAP
jgi:lipoate-protein ligase B